MDYTKELCRNTLGSDAHLQVNKKIMKEVGVEAAILIADLISKERYFENRDQLEEDGSFFNTQENIEKDTCLSAHMQRKAITELKNLNILSIRRKGVPAKNYYQIRHNKLLKLLTSSCENYEHLDVDDFNTNNNKEIRIKNNIYIDSGIGEHWSSQEGLIKHTPKTMDKNIKKKHMAIIEDVGIEETKQAITNYAFVVNSKNHYWTHLWPLWDFIARGLYKFIDEAKPKENFINHDFVPPSEGREKMLEELEEKIKKEKRK